MHSWSQIHKFEYVRKVCGGWKYTCTVGDFVWLRPFHHSPLVQLWSGDFLCGFYICGLLVICEGYRSDGATWCPDFKKGMRGFFFHDIICQFQFIADFRRLVATRLEGDRLMNRLHKEDDLACWLRPIVYRGVRVGAIGKPTVYEGVYIKVIDYEQVYLHN